MTPASTDPLGSLIQKAAQVQHPECREAADRLIKLIALRVRSRVRTKLVFLRKEEQDEAVADITVHVLTVLLRMGVDGDLPDNTRGFLNAIIRNKIKDLQRYHQAEKRKISKISDSVDTVGGASVEREEMQSSVEPHSECPDPETALINKQEKKRIWEAVARLLPRDANFIEGYLQGMPHKELAKEFGLTVGSSKSKVSHLLAQLRELIATPAKTN